MPSSQVCIVLPEAVVQKLGQRLLLFAVVAKGFSKPKGGHYPSPDG
ncbi:MAG: hypothetical protein ACLFUB_20070 [Cyclobacteriaceae bacterium]